jgi:hypothetical protein
VNGLDANEVCHPSRVVAASSLRSPRAPGPTRGCSGWRGSAS